MTLASQPVGRRERNKQQKLERIVAAASELFAEHGVEEVTTQQIADKADIGTGTLFLYAKTKGELLLLVQNTHYAEALEQGRTDAETVSDVRDAVMAIVQPIVACNRTQIDNGRTYLREVVFGDPEEPHHSEALSIVGRTEEAIAAVLSRDEPLGDDEAATMAHIVSAISFVSMAASGKCHLEHSGNCGRHPDPGQHPSGSLNPHRGLQLRAFASSHDERHTIGVIPGERMARYGKEHKDITRRRIIDAASKRFKQDGFDGSGVATLMADAGLTNGAFYAHFESKDDLVATVVHEELRRQAAAFGDLEPGRAGLEQFVREYLSIEHRDDRGTGCPSAALLDEIGRCSVAAKRAYTSGATAILDEITGRLSPDDPDSARGMALNLYAMLVGTMQLSRALTDRDLSKTVLENGTQTALAMLASDQRN